LRNDNPDRGEPWHSFQDREFESIVIKIAV
jgi:hypothetical protein